MLHDLNARHQVHWHDVGSAAEIVMRDRNNRALDVELESIDAVCIDSEPVEVRNRVALPAAYVQHRPDREPVRDEVPHLRREAADVAVTKISTEIGPRLIDDEGVPRSSSRERARAPAQQPAQSGAETHIFPSRQTAAPATPPCEKSKRSAT